MTRYSAGWTRHPAGELRTRWATTLRPALSSWGDRADAHDCAGMNVSDRQVAAPSAALVSRAWPRRSWRPAKRHLLCGPGLALR